jgi:hypothetical protein
MMGKAIGVPELVSVYEWHIEDSLDVGEVQLSLICLTFPSERHGGIDMVALIAVASAFCLT